VDYKKLIRKRETRLKLLRLLDFVPDKTMIKLQYRIKTGRKLNLKNPRRFTEKLQWYKLYYRTPLMKQCADKYEVRKYVQSKGLRETLNDLFGVYESFEDIDFRKLPDQFVFKATNGAGGLNVLFCKDKSKFQVEENRKLLEQWQQSKSYKSGGREWCYYQAKPRIIAERLLVNEQNPVAGIADYKFFCFNGVPLYVVVDVDRFIGHKRNFYDIHWNQIQVSSDCPNFAVPLPKPKGLDDMISVATDLSDEFPFVRVDLYYVSGRVYFGELTFYPWSGYVDFKPDEFDYRLGEAFFLLKERR